MNKFFYLKISMRKRIIAVNINTGKIERILTGIAELKLYTLPPEKQMYCSGTVGIH